eukprot:212061_1
MAFDLASINPSDFIEFRDDWITECRLESVGADRLFEDVGLLELIELDSSELREYAHEIGLTVIERKRFIKGLMKLNGIEPKTPSTPSLSSSTSNKSFKKTKKKERKSKSTNKRAKLKRKRSRSKSKSKSPTPSSRTPSADLDDVPMYDPTRKSLSSTQLPFIEVTTNIETDLVEMIHTAIEQIANDGTKTKADIRETFLEFRSKLTEREMKLLHDVDTTVDKKQRLLQTQLEYVKDNCGSNELCCDPSMKLLIERKDIMRTVITAGWVKGASSDNKEEQELQDRERKRRELQTQQYLTVERLKEVTLFERDCAAKREDSVRLTNEMQVEITKINVRTKKCEQELTAAKPLLEASRRLVSTISKTQLNEIRTLKKPPAVVELVMSSVAVMLGNKIKGWRDIQKIIANPRFVASIIDFDTMTLKKKTREECIKYVKHEDFNEERANKASKVAGPLVKWVKSQVKYSELLDVVRPMQKEIRVLKRQLGKKQKQLKMCVDVVNTLEMKISKSRTDINTMVDNMIEVQDKYNLNDEQDDKAMRMHSMGDSMSLLLKNISL